MADGSSLPEKASDSGEFVIRSGVRAGLKREFAFALRAQAELLSTALPRSRTRSGARPALLSPSPHKKRKPSDSLAAIQSDADAMVVVQPEILDAMIDDMPDAAPPHETATSAYEIPIADGNPIPETEGNYRSGGSPATSGVSVGSAEGQAMSVTSAESGSGGGSIRVTPKRKMELKMSKKIALTKLPSSPREFLTSGLLDGSSVKYIIYKNKQDGLRGIIKDGGIVCSCDSCRGSKVISAYQFEQHAGSTKKYPWDYIFLENGSSIRRVFEACTAAPLDMLEAAVQNAIGQTPVRKPLGDRKCKEPLYTPSVESSKVDCDSCLGPEDQLEITPELLHDEVDNARLARPVPLLDSTNGAPKIASAQKKLTSGKLTKKDIGMHKLVFSSELLPEGLEVGYFVRGKKLLGGYIKDSGIFCDCCSTVVSASQFESHAGEAKRRKPYNHIYTSNGVSLHELSVSLSKKRKLASSQNDDLCNICEDGGDLLLCDLCPRAFHKECVELSDLPEGEWYCQFCKNMLQREKCVESNNNAYAAGRVAGVDPIEQIYKRCIRIVTMKENNVGGCVFCRQHDFCNKPFGQRTVLICDQCEREYHVGCMKEHNMADLKELPLEKWFCSTDCCKIYAALEELLLLGPQPVPCLDLDVIKRKREEKGLITDTTFDVSWRLLSGRYSSPGSEMEQLLSKVLSTFHESFDPIIDIASGKDLIPYMVNGNTEQEFGGMYCAVLTVGSSIVSAGIFRILGSEVAELPLVATSRECQGLGYFQLLFSCIESLLGSLKVKHFLLPSAEEAESIWTNKFGFARITQEQLCEYTKAARIMVFEGTSMLHKLVPDAVSSESNG